MKERVVLETVIQRGEVGQGDWGMAVSKAKTGQALLLTTSWAALEPERGRFDDAVLEGWGKAIRDARKKGVEPIVCLHDGALPDWQMARGGWLDPDVTATWGCFVDHLARGIAESVGTWIVFRSILEEAAWYLEDAPAAARVMLDAHAGAYLMLHRGPGFGGRPSRVGAMEIFADWQAPKGLRRQLDVLKRRQFGPEVLLHVLSTGKLEMPFAWVGELPNGTPALDLVGVDWRGAWVVPDGPRLRPAQGHLAHCLRKLWGLRQPLLLIGCDEDEVQHVISEGVRVDIILI